MKRKKTTQITVLLTALSFMLVLSLFPAGSTRASDAYPVTKGTRGTPLGGIGTGYVKFDATTGEFAASSRIPPAAGDMACEFPDKMSSSCGFHFFAGGQSIKKATTVSEDAKCPLYSADFGKLNGAHFLLSAFGPFIPGDNELNIQLATSPIAFFEITAMNEGTSAIDVAVALEFANNSAGTSGLLGGADIGERDTGSETGAVSFPTATFVDIPSNPDNTGNAYMTVGCGKEGASFSAGSLGEFLSTGILANGNGNCVAGKCNLGGGESAKFKFVMSWWRSFVSGSDRYESGKNDEDNYYYHNFYRTSKDAAAFGMRHFDKVRDGVASMVRRVMGSNFPGWYKERLLNNTYPLIQNSLWTKDGRAAFWEGGYGIIGTIDQGENASIWYTFNWPKNQWMELSYWLGTALRDSSLAGQIHHDFNKGVENFENGQNPEARFICPWDNYNRNDYWYQPNTSDWSDLNTMAIFKAYELMLATGDLDSMKRFFPFILRTAERLLTQSAEGGRHLPINSKSTYDTEMFGTPQYAAGIALTAFLAVSEMAKFVGDTTSARKYLNWYAEARREFRTLLFNSNFCTGRNFAEGDIAGYSWANYFCFEPVMDAEVIDEGCRRLWNLYTSSASTVQEKLGRWHFYTCDHWGGSEIARGKPDTAMTIFRWDYDYYHTVRRDMIFWQDLWGDLGNYSSYMTAPSVWRSYFQMTGYLLDNANNRLWLRPRIPAVMGNRIVNAPLPNPHGWGNLTFDGSLVEVPGQVPKRTQKLAVAFDSLITVREIVLNNNTESGEPYVLVTAGSAPVNGYTCTTHGADLEKNIRIAFAQPVRIGPSGLQIEVYTGKVGVAHACLLTQKQALSINTAAIAAGKPIRFTVDAAGPIVIELLTLDGAKIGTLMRRHIATPGAHAFIWDGGTKDGGKTASAMMVLKLSARSKSVYRLVFPEFK